MEQRQAKPLIPLNLVFGQTLKERVRYKHRQLGVKHEKGKVLAVEILMTASPEWWATANNHQKKEFFERSVKSLHDKFGKGVVSIIVHTDESTPHIQAVIVPVYQAIEKKRGAKPSTPEGIAKRLREEAEAPMIWRISYDKILGGDPQVLADYQTEYHSYVEHLGLARGEDTRGDGKKHMTLKDRAKQLDAKEERQSAVEKQLLEDREELANDQAFFEAESQRLINDLQIYRNSVAQTEAKKRRLVKRERRLSQRSKMLEGLEKSVNLRDHISQQRFAEVEEKERDLTSRETDVIAKLSGLETRNADIATAKSDLDRNTTALADEKAVIAKREKNVTVQERQIGIIGEMASGERLAVWAPGNDRPTMAAKDVDTDTQEAVEATWSEKLVKAGIAIAKLIPRRSRLAEIIARLRKARRAARAKQILLKARESSIGQKEQNAADIERRTSKRLAVAADKLAEANRSMEENEREKIRISIASAKLDHREASAEAVIHNMKQRTAIAVRETTVAETKLGSGLVDHNQ